jgi:hypothetical protein
MRDFFRTASLLLLVFLSGCTVVIKDREAIPQRERERATGSLRAYCPSKIETAGFYCTGNRAYSNLVQAGSRVKVYSQSTGKSITIAIYRGDDINGVCVPERFESLLGRAPFRAVLEVERCGLDGNTVCPPVIRGMASWYGEPYHGRETPAEGKELKKPQRGGGKGNRQRTLQGGQGVGPLRRCGKEVWDDRGWSGARGGGGPSVWRLGALYYAL